MSITSKADMLEVENMSRSEDPSPAFLAAEEYMDSIHAIDLQSDNELAQYFVSTSLPRIILSLLKRGDLDEDVEERAYVFLESTLLFIARTIDCGMDQLPLLLDEIFMERSHPFYVNSISRSLSDIAEIGDIDDGPEIFEDEERARHAVFALRQPGAGEGVEGAKEAEWLGIGRVNARRGRTSCSEGRLICNVNVFGRYGGFRRLKDAIMQARDPSQITRVRNLLSPVFEVKEFLATEFVDWFIAVFHHVADHILLRLSDEELKNEFRSVNDIVNSLSGLIRLSSSTRSQEHIDKLKLEVALKGLKSRYLERRLSGLGDINDVLETLAEQLHGDNRAGQDVPCWADSEFMCNWLKSNQVLEEMFVHNAHTEVLKRSRRVLLFLSEWGELGEKEVHMMWEASLGKHESIEKLMVDLLGQVARHLRTIKALQGLLQLVTGLEPSAFTTQHIELVRRITCLMIQAEQKEGSGVDPFMGINVLWEMIQDEFKFPLAEMHNFCLQCFVGVLELQESRPVRGEYFGRCVKNLKAHQSVPQSLMVMNGLFLAIAVKRKEPEIDWASFGCVQDERELLDIVLADLVWYQGLPVAMQLDVGEEGLGPRYSRQEELQQRLSFISSILELERGSLAEEQMDCLWETLVKKAVNGAERDLVFGWLEGLLRCRWTRERITPVLDSLFSNHICTQDPSLLSEGGFRLSRYAMLVVNCTKGFVEDVDRQGDYGKLVLTTTEPLKGAPFVWEVAVGARNQHVAQQAIAFLIEVYQNLSPTLQPLPKLIETKRHEFIASCMQHLERAAGDTNKKKRETRASRCVWLLTSFLKEFEGTLASTGSHVLLRKHSSAQPHVSNQGSTPAVHAQSSSSSNETASIPDEDREHKSIQENKGKSSQAAVASAPKMAIRAQGHENQLPANRDVSMADADGDASASPHDILSQKYFDQIFRLLEGSSGNVSAQVWDLIGLLPTNDKMLKSLRMLEAGWAEAFAMGGLYSLLYKLQIVERLVTENSQWRDRFVSNGGLTVVLKVMLGMVFESAGSAQRNACLALSLKLTSTLLSSAPSVVVEEGDDVPMSEAVAIEKHLKSDDEVKHFVDGIMNILAKAAQSVPAVDQHEEGVEDVVQHAVNLLAACAGTDARVLRCVYAYGGLQSWLRITLLQSKSPSIRLTVAQGIIRIAWQQESDWHSNFSICAPSYSAEGEVEALLKSAPCPHPLLWFLGCLLSLVSSVDPGCATCGEAFDLVSCLLIKAGQLPEQFPGKDSPRTRSRTVEEVENTLGPMLDSAGERLRARMFNHAIVEERGSAREDRVLFGMLVTMQSLLLLRPSLKHALGPSRPSGPGLVKFLYRDALFDLPTVENHQKTGPPICKMAKTRSAAFELLFTLVQNSPAAYSELLALLTAQHSKHEVRPLHAYRPQQLEKAQCGFVGMRNLGATCYMNSLLQHLFNVQEFRRGILQAPLEQQNKSGSLMYQLQSLFGYLQESEKQFAETWEMCQVYTDYDGQPINTAVQMDADEFFNMLFEKLEDCLKGTDQEHLLQECFGGKVVNQIICKEEVTVGDKVYGLNNPFKSEREESFYTLSLEVKHKRSILESLELFVEGEVLEGDNKYFCEEANCKVSAVKRVCIKQLPPTMILHLKRFEFDLDLMKKIKVNDLCEFPMILNMEPYTRDGIERRERAQRQGRPAPPTPRGIDTEYDLVGVLVHTGTSDSGHYYSYAKVGGDAGEDEEGIWYLFNDTQVEAFDEEEIPAACYGGKEFTQDADGTCRPQAKSRSYSAYMLLYRQRRSMAARAKAREGDAVVEARQGMAQSINGGVPVPLEIMQTVWAENIQLLRDKLVYDPAYLSFAKRVCSLQRFFPIPDDAEALEQGRVVLELAARILMDTVIHTWSPEVEGWVELIQSLLPGDGVERSRWLLDAFVADVEERGAVVSQLWLFKALVANRNADARQSLVALLAQAARAVAEEERSVTWAPNAGGHVPFCECDSSGASSSDASSSPPSTPRAPRGGAGGSLPRGGSGGVGGGSGGKAAVQRPSLVGRWPAAATTVARFLDRALELLPELPPHWRHFGEYFQLLSLVAELGPQEKAFMLSRRVVGRCVDVLLHEVSPFAREHRHRVRMGDKVSGPNFNFLLDLVCKLVCSVELEREVEAGQAADAPAPTQLEVVGAIDTTSLNMVRHKLFVKKVLLEGVNPPKALRLLQHLSWNHARQSALILQAACEVVESEEEYDVLFHILRALLGLQDAVRELRTDKFVGCFLKAVYNNLQYPEACVRCLELLGDEVCDSPLLRSVLLRSILVQHRHRDVCRWFEACLLRVESDPIRVAAEHLALAIALPALRAPAPTSPEPPAASPRPAPPAPARAAPDQLTKTLFEHLISLEEGLLHSAALDRPRGFSSSPLASYVRCLSTIVELVWDDGWFKAQFRRHFSKFHQLLEGLNEIGHEMDVSKAELIRLFYACATDSPETLDLLTDQFSGVRESLLGYYIIIRPHRAHIVYNRQNLPVLYNLLLLCCKHSASFTAFVMGHRNSTWAVDNFICSSTRYPETVSVLLRIVDEALALPGQPEVVSDFKRRLLQVMLGSKSVANCPDNATALFRRLLDDVVSSGDDLVDLADSPLLDCFLAALAQSHPSCTGTGRRPALPAEDSTASALRILHRLLPALHFHLDDPALVAAVGKCKARAPAVHALFKALHDPAAPPDLRPLALDVLNHLIRADPSCAAAGVEELSRAYDAAPLQPLAAARRRLGRSELHALHIAVAPPSEPPAPRGAPAEGSASAERGAGRQGEVVVELWPSCRGAASKESMGAWWEVAAELCDACMDAVEERMGAARWRSAVRLLLSCLLDCLPDTLTLDSPAHLVRLCKLLSRLLEECRAVKASDTQEGVRLMVSTEAAADLVLEALKAEPYTSAFLVRAILCYKAVLQHPDVVDAVVAVARLVVPLWGGESTRRVVKCVFADAIECAERVKAAGELTKEAATELAVGLATEAWPLPTIHQVPGFLSQAVELRGDNAGDEVLQAVEELRGALGDTDALKRVGEQHASLAAAMRASKPRQGRGKP